MMRSHPDHTEAPHSERLSLRRRQLLKAAASTAPLVATLPSGAALANASAYNCVQQEINSPAPDPENPESTYITSMGSKQVYENRGNSSDQKTVYKIPPIGASGSSGSSGLTPLTMEAQGTASVRSMEFPGNGEPKKPSIQGSGTTSVFTMPLGKSEDEPAAEADLPVTPQAEPQYVDEEGNLYVDADGNPVDLGPLELDYKLLSDTPQQLLVIFTTDPQAMTVEANCDLPPDAPTDANYCVWPVARVEEVNGSFQIGMPLSCYNSISPADWGTG
jgi:hypothetical protein